MLQNRVRIFAAIIGCFAAAVIGFMWVSPEAVLGKAARLWVASDRLDHADAIVVLGGGLDVRPAAAADLYKRGISPRILVAKAEADQGRDARLARDALLQHGVPAAAIGEFGFVLHSTYGEARGLLEWVKRHEVGTVIIPVDIFSTRRVRWIFNHELGPAGVRARVYAVTPGTYSLTDWWQHEAGVHNFRNELVKFVYYRLRYGAFRF